MKERRSKVNASRLIRIQKAGAAGECDTTSTCKTTYSAQDRTWTIKLSDNSKQKHHRTIFNANSRDLNLVSKLMAFKHVGKK
jgi:hypothetical protein